MLKKIEVVAKDFLEKTQDKQIQIISHHDTDGITSATIMIKTLKELGKSFSVKIIKNLDEQFIYNLPKGKINLFLDLGSGSLNYIAKSGLENVFIIDHHEITQQVPLNVQIINPHLHEREEISGSGLTYLFCKEISQKKEDKELANLAVLGMIGDMLIKSISKPNNRILNDSELTVRKGLLLYPSTRPLNKTLEFCSNPYIPGVTGNPKGVINLLRETGLVSKDGKYKSLIELDNEEMSKLITAVLLRRVKKNNDEDIIGNIYLLKFFNKLEDARELSAIINACSRLGESDAAILFCLQNSKAKKRVESLYAKYKQMIVSSLNSIQNLEKIEGKGYVIINAKREIKDTIIGTIASILSNSSLYEEGTIITTMAHYEDKIKVSSRIVGGGRNVREILNNTIIKIGGEVGGHHLAAGCNISQSNEKEFIEQLKKHLEVEIVKV